MVIVFAHRGATGFPACGENTIGSLTQALHRGAGGLEFDVRRCGDGRIVVIHDDTIDRTTNGRGRVADFTYDELKQFDAGSGEAVPLLSDVLDRFGAQCLLNIELKDAGLGGDIRKLLLERRLERHVIVSAFDWAELAPFPPEVPIGLLTYELENLIEMARKLGASAIHPRKNIMTPRLLAAAREAHLRTHVWTVNDPGEIASLRMLGVDGIFTDFPERCWTPAS